MTSTKTLMLMRHAHSGAAAAPFGPDHDRKLTKRGVQACRTMAAWMAKNGFLPDFVHCSTAARAQETWDRVSGHLAGSAVSAPIPGTHTRDLYLAPPQTILRHLSGTPDTMGTVICVAHNPGIADLALQLALRTPGADRAELALKYPTAALAIYRFTGDWASVAQAETRLLHYITPGKLATDR